MHRCPHSPGGRGNQSLPCGWFGALSSLESLSWLLSFFHQVLLVVRSFCLFSLTFVTKALWRNPRFEPMGRGVNCQTHTLPLSAGDSCLSAPSRPCPPSPFRLWVEVILHTHAGHQRPGWWQEQEFPLLMSKFKRSSHCSLACPGLSNSVSCCPCLYVLSSAGRPPQWEIRDKNRSGVGWQRAAGDTKWVFTFLSIFGLVSEPGEMGRPTREMLKGKDT